MPWMSRYLVIAAVILLTTALGAAFHKAYQHGFDMARALGQRELAEYRESVNRASAKAAADAFGRYVADSARAKAAEKQFLSNQTADSSRTATLKGQIDHAAQPHYSTKSSKHSTPQNRRLAERFYFSHDFVRLWNEAARSGSPVAAGADSSCLAGSSAADAAADSGVSQADLLEWFVDYAARTHLLENKLNAVRAALPNQP
ncbi:hypothetical protein [Caballeronia sp. LZ001]|uniref:hypothetical protein n=1 Tax=Caballeronia sp. LZ001 TaxID=3038553 RepID=UPI0028570501|nr:hypothetical protein [Caballeronia sp. LZ001]MDR5803419.1 hypothetical protein [Caballeronia sp. LZ001]